MGRGSTTGEVPPPCARAALVQQAHKRHYARLTSFLSFVQLVLNCYKFMSMLIIGYYPLAAGFLMLVYTSEIDFLAGNDHLSANWFVAGSFIASA